MLSVLRRESIYLWYYFSVQLEQILLSPIPAARGTEWYISRRAAYAGAVNGDSALLSEICASVRKTYWTSGCYIYLGRGAKEKAEIAAELIDGLPA